jgi:hypothetical protein
MCSEWRISAVPSRRCTQGYLLCCLQPSLASPLSPSRSFPSFLFPSCSRSGEEREERRGEGPRTGCARKRHDPWERDGDTVLRAKNFGVSVN